MFFALLVLRSMGAHNGCIENKRFRYISTVIAWKISVVPEDSATDRVEADPRHICRSPTESV